MNTKRRGILAGGNFIVDRVKRIDHYPREQMLASILDESVSNGGGPYNVLKDLAHMNAPFPLEAVGLLGDDEDGDWIISDCQAAGIDTAQLHRTSKRPTSYTDAMTVAATGKRTFFHQRGANALLDVQHFEFSKSTARIFHLGYLMLLDQLDQREADGRSRAAMVLASAQAAGLTTSVDLVSVDAEDFSPIVCSAMPSIDHLVINETEAGKATGTALAADDVPALLHAGAKLLAAGVRETVTIHAEGGAVCCESTGATHIQPALALDDHFVKRGANGAGDAFAAGYLWGLHEGQRVAERLRLAVCTAAMSLSDPTPSGGLQPVSECLALADRHPWNHFGQAHR